MNDVNPVPEEQSQTDRAYQELRAAIVRCEFEPGSRLRVEELTKRFSVSSSPLREALSRLAGQGLVHSQDNRGFRVAPLSREGITDLTRVRILIEREALIDAIDHGDDTWESEIVAAAHRLALSETRVGTNAALLDEEWSTRHRAFHMAVYSAATSPLMRALVADLFDASERYRRFSARFRKGKRNKNSEHQEIMGAVLARDKKGALERLTRHITSTEENVLAAFATAEARRIQ